jgi:hypothetical protein
MIVEEHRVARKGKKDKVWKEVKYSSQEWAIMMTGAALIAVLVSAANNTEYPTNLLGVIVFTLIMMAVFAFVIWDIVSVLAIYYAEKKGTTVRRTE